MRGEQIPDPAAVREGELGIELGERLEDEAALCEARVRDAQAGLVDRLLAVEQKVEVDRPRAEARPRPLASERALDGEHPLKERAGGELGVDRARGVEEAGLVDVPDGVRLAKSGDRDDADVGPVEEVERAPEVSGTIAEVRSEADVRAGHVVQHARMSLATRLFRDRETAQAVAAVAVAALAFGVSFGVLARAAGMGALAPVVMSATTFAGSAQFAATSVLETGSVAAAVAAAVMLNARYTAMGAAVGPLFTGGLPRRVVHAQLVVDEAWALANRGGGRFDLPLFTRIGLVLYAGWVSGTAIGVLGAEFVGDPERLGLDAAFPALFLALLVPQVRTRQAAAVAVLGGAIALVLLPVAPAGIPIVVASAACLLGARRP